MMESQNINAKLLNDDLARKTTFAGDARRSSLSRAFTFDGAAIRQTVSQPFEGLTRTLTEVGNRFDPDAKFTKAVISDYKRVAEEGNEGDIPLPPGFARKYKFWKLIFFGALVATFMGVASAAFLNFGDEVPKQWNSCDYANDFECGDWYNGEKYWIFITTATGFLIGLIRWTFSYPDNLPGIFKEIQTYHVEPKWAPVTYLISALSLGGGATLGPEQALGNLGGGIAYFVGQYVDFEDEDYQKIFVLSGMSGALGALFPSPMLGALMMHELGEPPKTFMESTIILSISACVGFAVYYEMVDATYLDHISTSGINVSEAWIAEDGGYESYQIVTGFVVGIISAFLCIGCLLTTGVCKQIFFRIRDRLKPQPFLSEVVPPTIGGLAVGLTNWALPATFGNGSMVFDWIIKFGANGTASQKLLLCTGFARMFLLGVCMNCGYVGGIIFPFLTMGLISGTIMYVNYPGIPLGLCLGTFMISIACGIVPMPFTFSGLAIFVFFFGLYQTVPIFVASFTSYMIVCGSGLFKRLAKNAQKQNAVEEGVEAEEIDDKSQASAKQEADEFALKQYLGNKKPGVQSIQATNAAAAGAPKH